MKLPLSVLMYQLSDEYDYQTVNVDVSSAYDGVKLFDEGELNNEDEKFLYLIDEEMMEKYHNDVKYAQTMSASVFICLCKNSESAVCTQCRDLSVVFLYADVNFAYIFNRIQKIVKKFDDWEKLFHLSLLRRRSMQELVDITEELLTHPLIVLDNNYSMIGHTRSMEEVGPLMRGIIEKKYTAPLDLQRLRNLGAISDFDSFDSPEINRYTSSNGSEYYSIMYKFVCRGKIVAYALAFHCISHPTKGYLYLMNMIAERMQLYFEQENANDNSSPEAYQTFLAGILNNPDISDRQLKDQAGHISGLDVEGIFILAQVQYNRMNEMSYSFISWSIRNSMPEFMPFVFRDNFYILKNSSQSEEHLVFLTEKEEKLFYKCFNHMDFSCGVSMPFFSLKKLTSAASQCREAISTGHMLSGKDMHMYHYNEVIFYHMLIQLKKVMPLDLIESPYYIMLRAHDEANRTDLCEIMLKYILNGCSVTRTAAATYMHRNTILNKVKKASEIMENSLEDFQSQVFFVISYMAENSLPQ